MKKNILIFLKSVIFVVALLIAVVYYVNFRAEGTTAYVTRGCIVYNSPDLSNPIGNLSVGEAVTSLVYHGNANKIRYTDDSGDTIVGFVSEHVLGYYVFPGDINCESVILTVSNKTDFNDFVSTLVSLDEEDFSLVGVYEDFSLKYSSGIDLRLLFFKNINNVSMVIKYVKLSLVNLTIKNPIPPCL